MEHTNNSKNKKRRFTIPPRPIAAGTRIGRNFPHESLRPLC